MANCEHEQGVRADGKQYVCQESTRTISSLQILQKSQGNYGAIEWAVFLNDVLETQWGKHYKKDFIACYSHFVLFLRERGAVERSREKLFSVDNS